MTPEADHRTDFVVKLPTELARRLAERIDGQDVSAYVEALIRADLERPVESAATNPDFERAVEQAGRFMDRYRNACKELSK